MSAPLEPVTLHRGGAKALVWPGKGAVVSSLALLSPRGEPREVLWMPEEFSSQNGGWPGGGIPLLFPFAGRVWDEGRVSRYRLGDRVFEMGLHGFAYDKPWSVVSAHDRAAELLLEDDPESRRVFPFGFRLSYTIQLHESALELELGIQHKPAGEAEEQLSAMPVACGFHPYFRMPIGDSGSWESCHLKASARRRIAVTGDGAAGKSKALKASATRTPLSDSSIHNLILGDHVEPRLSLIDERLGEAVAVSWEPGAINYSVLWAKKEEGFFCAEPWMGLPDAVHSGLGCRWLAAGETVSLSVRIDLAPIQVVK